MTGRVVGIRLCGAAILVLAACNTPVPSLRLVPAPGPSQACPSTKCAEVPMTCRTVMSIRIIDPKEPTAPYLSQCVDVPFDPKRTMCSLASVDLDPTPIPVRDLEVQVALYPASAIQPDPDAPDKLLCPTSVQYSAATGFPIEPQSPTPALGGRAFYHPGDETVVVTLGCTDLAAVNEACTVSNPLAVTAMVDEFDTLFPVPGDPSGTAGRLKVSVGEPKETGDAFSLSAVDSRELQLATTGGSSALWSDDVDLDFDKFVCIDVYEIAPQATAALRCRAVSSSPHLDLRGVRVTKDTLQQILSALFPSVPPPLDFPDEGLTIGLVVDQASNPVPGIVVSATPGGATVKYLSNQGTLGGSATSNSGIFVSRDAPFRTTFSTSGGGRPTVSAVGGLVKSMVTVVVLQYGGPPL